MTRVISRALLLGAVLMLVGLLIGLLLTPAGWVLVLLGFCVYVYIPMVVIFRAVRPDAREPVRPENSPTIVGFLIRAIQGDSSQNQTTMARTKPPGDLAGE
jgi:hypothetical protein